VACTSWTREVGQQALGQITAPIGIGGPAQVQSERVHEIEAEENTRRGALGRFQVRRCLQACPILQRFKRRAPIAQRNDFAI